MNLKSATLYLFRYKDSQCLYPIGVPTTIPIGRCHELNGTWWSNTVHSDQLESSRWEDAQCEGVAEPTLRSIEECIPNGDHYVFMEFTDVVSNSIGWAILYSLLFVGVVAFISASAIWYLRTPILGTTPLAACI